MRAALAPAKLNLSLRVFSPDEDGYHPLDSLVQAIDWYDHVRVDHSESDQITVEGLPAPSDRDNLAWKALEMVRQQARIDRPILMELSKRIPAAAGLGGGSSDAVAASVASAALLDTSPLTSEHLSELGSDVPFFAKGGLARMTGRGDRLERLDPAGEYAVAVVVPPIELSTPAVYRRWDALGGPTGDPLPDRAVPPRLRSEPLQNDLWPAAIDIEPSLGDWRAELVQQWGTAVAMTGSGSALFGFFGGREEAEEALREVDQSVRARRAAVPVGHGAHLDPRYTPERP